MTDTEREALCTRIDELCAELGRSQLNRDMWHDRAETMRNRLSAAQAENERLTETLRGAEREADRLTHEAAELSIENAKLRELVDYMTPIAWYAASERERDHMRELGIEVPA